MNRQERWINIGLLASGLLAAAWIGRVFFLYPPDRMHVNHEGSTYAGRLLEFRDQLGAGYLVPQWCTSFRGGLGSAQFCYYQPGFFYAASLVPWSVSPVRALGATVVLFALLGYLATYALVRPRFGRLGGWLAANSLLLSVYAATNICIRGDLSEFAAMMMLPALLWALLGWLDQGRLACAAWLAPIAAAVVLLHSIVGMLAVLLMAVVLVAFWIETRDHRRVGAAVLVLAIGAGMASVYWLPVVFELNLVDTDRAFVGFFSYTRHFVDPLKLLGRYHRNEIIPFSLGGLFVLLVGFNVLSCLYRRRELSVSQRRLVILAILVALVFAWLMTRESTFVWRLAPTLQRMQFPWRILTVVTVAMALLAGATLPWRSEKTRAAVTLLLVLAMWALSIDYTDCELDREHRVLQTVDELAETFFAPDLRNEWVPRGATIDIPEADRTMPVAGPGCRVSDYRRQARRLSCQVAADEATTLVLPHYFFPVGWQATLDGRPIPLSASPLGLMRFELPAHAHGQLEVVFTQTPMHRLGLAISGLSCLLGLIWLALAARRRGRCP